MKSSIQHVVIFNLKSSEGCISSPLWKTAA